MIIWPRSTFSRTKPISPRAAGGQHLRLRKNRSGPVRHMGLAGKDGWLQVPARYELNPHFALAICLPPADMHPAGTGRIRGPVWFPVLERYLAGQPPVMWSAGDRALNPEFGGAQQVLRCCYTFLPHGRGSGRRRCARQCGRRVALDGGDSCGIGLAVGVVADPTSVSLPQPGGVQVFAFYFPAALQTAFNYPAIMLLHLAG